MKFSLPQEFRTIKIANRLYSSILWWSLFKNISISIELLKNLLLYPLKVFFKTLVCGSHIVGKNIHSLARSQIQATYLRGLPPNMTPLYVRAVATETCSLNSTKAKRVG